MSINYTAASDKAKKYLQKNQLDRAIALWTEYLPSAADNDAANALNNLGDLCVRKKNTVAAIDHFLKASHAFETAGFPLKAIATLKKVLKLDPDRAEVYLRLGDLNARRDMIGNAVEAYLHVARLLVSQGERDEALTMVQKICILDPVNTRHRLQLAAELFELGFTEQAIDETINAVDLFLETGNLEEAERYCRHLLDLKPGCEAAQERIERIARWGAERPEAGSADVEGSIDDMFAELDGPGTGPGSAPEAPQAAPAPEPAVAGSFTLDLGPAGPLDAAPEHTDGGGAEDGIEPPATAEADIRDLLETTSQVAHGDEGGDEAPAGFGEMDLESTSLHGGDGPADDAASAETDALHGEAMGRLQHGDLEGALDLFDRLADAHMAAGNPGAADAALADYMAIDPDNARAYEIRLRVVTGHDRDAERSTLERLAEVYRDSDPDKAHAFEARLGRMGGGTGAPESGTDEPAAFVVDTAAPSDDDAELMGISLSNLSLAAAEATADVEAEPEPEPEQPAGEWTLDLSDDHGAEAFALESEAAAGPESAPEPAPAAHEEEPLDTAALDLSSHFHAEPEPEHSETTAHVDLTPPGGEVDADEIDRVPGLEVGGPGQDPAARPKAPSHAGGYDPKEALTEARFYERQGLQEEAIHAYRTVLSHEPGNAEAAKRLKGLGVEPAPAAAGAPQGTPPAKPADGHGSDEFLDFTEAIEDTIEKEVSGSWRKVGEEAQFDEILDAFRKGIRAEVSDDDAETHYDLGLAYHEMGLTEEAIGEFQLAIKGVTRFADATIMLARCFTELGKDRLAVSRLKTAVARTDCGEGEWISLAYELATVLDGMGQKDEARQMYEEVYARDINYRDVAKRVARLT